MSISTMALLAALTLWILLESKTSRSDGKLVRTHPYRRMMHFIMPSRGASVVYYESLVPAEPLLAYLERARPRLGADITHCVVAAGSVTLGENPRLNRFVTGFRLYQRHGRWVTFSMKRVARDAEAKLSAVKMMMRDGETFAQLCARVNGDIDTERSGKKTAADKEFDLFSPLPRPVLRVAVPLFKLLDYYNLLPAFFIRDDAMFTGLFAANLGSIGMGAGYHHLYEWGNCPFFVMVGQIEERAVVVDGQVVARRFIPLRFTYDERVDDGLTGSKGIETLARVLTEPERYLGCLAEDGSDTRPLWPREKGPREKESGPREDGSAKLQD